MDTLKKTSLKPELNGVLGSFVLVSSIALEALGLLPVSTVFDVPCTMRCSAITLIALLGGDIVGASSQISETRDFVHGHPFELEQRLTLVFLLLLIAGLGERRGEDATRMADASFVLLSGFTTVVLFAGHRKPTPACALFGAFLFYSGVRITSQAFSHCNEVLEFTVSFENSQSLGYALSDCVASTALAFGGSCCACCGIYVIANEKTAQLNGAAALTPVVCQIAALAFAAALAAQLAMCGRNSHRTSEPPNLRTSEPPNHKRAAWAEWSGILHRCRVCV
tara:strand:+ start:4975 stop:5814 length:840 start_codon:yes stop_codon:yes gene_type:complete